ncbi:MAG: CopG family transcriptional regulator [Burkholderiaceae bacterium]
MAQITLYLDEETQALMEQAAKASDMSRSRWVAELIRAQVRRQWPRSFLEAAGSIPDFPLRGADPAPETADVPRIGL